MDTFTIIYENDEGADIESIEARAVVYVFISFIFQLIFSAGRKG